MLVPAKRCHKEQRRPPPLLLLVPPGSDADGSRAVVILLLLGWWSHGAGVGGGATDVKTRRGAGGGDWDAAGFSRMTALSSSLLIVGHADDGWIVMGDLTREADAFHCYVR